MRSRLTYANVISSLCLFLLLGGGTAAALTGANTVFSDDIVDHQVRPQDLAKLAFTPVKPNPVTVTEPCASGKTGIFCGNIGANGLLRGWADIGHGYANVAFARDGLGIVHLQGTMYEPNHTPDTSFILPDGYRPRGFREFVVAYGQSDTCGGLGCDERHTVVQVGPSGSVMPLRDQPGAGQHFSEGVSLDGVEFEAK